MWPNPVPESSSLEMRRVESDTASEDCSLPEKRGVEFDGISAMVERRDERNNSSSAMVEREMRRVMVGRVSRRMRIRCLVVNPNGRVEVLEESLEGRRWNRVKRALFAGQES